MKLKHKIILSVAILVIASALLNIGLRTTVTESNNTKTVSQEKSSG